VELNVTAFVVMFRKTLIGKLVMSGRPDTLLFHLFIGVVLSVIGEPPLKALSSVDESAPSYHVIHAVTPGKVPGLRKGIK